MKINNVKIFEKEMPEDKRDIKTERVVKKLRELLKRKNISLVNSNSDKADLVIAVGGDGTFLRACRNENFSSEAVFVGVNTGTLGFLQDLNPNELFSLIEYIQFEENLYTKEIDIGEVFVKKSDGQNFEENFMNEILIGGEDYSKIDFDEYVHGSFLQKISATAIVICTPIGQTAYSMNLGGGINFINSTFLTTTLMAPIRNSLNADFIERPLQANEFEIYFKNNRDRVVLKVDYLNLGSYYGDEISSIKVVIGNKKIRKLDISNVSIVDTIREKFIGK